MLQDKKREHEGGAGGPNGDVGGANESKQKEKKGQKKKGRKKVRVPW